MLRFPYINFNLFKTDELCEFIAQRYFEDIQSQLQLLYKPFTEDIFFKTEDEQREILPFLYLQLRDDAQQLMRYEKLSVFPYIKSINNPKCAKTAFSFHYVGQLHDKVLTELRRLVYLLNKTIILQQSKTWLQILQNDLKTLENMVLDWNYFVQGLLQKRLLNHVIQN